MSSHFLTFSHNSFKLLFIIILSSSSLLPTPFPTHSTLYSCFIHQEQCTAQIFSDINIALEHH